MYLTRLTENFSSRSLFATAPLVEFKPVKTGCNKCGKPLSILKTRNKTIYTMAVGKIIAKECFLRCQCCKEIYRSGEPVNLVPFRCQYGFDVMVWIGKALFLEGKGEKVILESLKKYNIDISSSEISYLGKKFIAYLAVAHRECEYELKKFISKKGGYILHFDGTCDGNSPHLITGLDEISDMILKNVKIPSEKSDHLVPFFDELKNCYGTPIALVHDMGAGFKSAVETVFPGVPDFICHYHFLRDIGKDLFEKEYRQLKACIARLKIRNLLQVKARLLIETKELQESNDVAEDLMTSLKAGTITTEHLREFPSAVTFALIRWALDTRFDLDGYGFPFDQHHYAFYCRLKTVHETLNKIMNVHISGNWKDNRHIYRIKHFLDKMFSDRPMIKAVKILNERIKVFNKLRQAMRITEPNGKDGLNDDGKDPDIRTIKERVIDFREWITTVEQFKGQPIYNKMIKQLDTYWEKLFADPIQVSTPHGDLWIQPQRTNNILERFFRDLRRTCRKRTGMNSINKHLKAMLADTPLVKNLQNEEYLRILLCGTPSLEKRFAKIDAQLIRSKMHEASQYQSKLSPALRKVVYRKQLPIEVEQLFLHWASAA